MKTSQDYHNQRRVWNAVTWAIIAFAVLCLGGIVVSIVMLGFRMGSPELLGILCGGFVAGAALFGGFGFLCYRKTDDIAALELDALEIEDSIDSFHVGEGTLATFERGQLCIHGTDALARKITVPYASMKFYSVCSRRAPKEKGRWSVVMEIPAHFLAKGGRPRAGEPPALIQTDGKERLYACLEKYGISLIGEPPQGESVGKNFERVQKFTLPDTQKRGRALILMILAVALVGGGIAAAILWEVTVGSVLSLVGVYIGIRAVLAFVRAKAELIIYQEGIFYREPSSVDNAFLKWEEFSKLFIFEQDGKRYLRVQCPYGAYDFPDFSGAYEYIAEHYPDKCGV